MFNSVVPYGIAFATHRLTSLDHSVWFHRACDVGDWLLFDQTSSAAADGRGMNEGLPLLVREPLRVSLRRSALRF